MKFAKSAAAFAIGMLLGCTREYTPALSGSATKTGPETVEAVQPADLGVEAGVALVYLDESLTAKAERGAAVAVLPENLRVSAMDRLFPDAGQWEPRTRAAGLHRWYVVEYDKKISSTQACLTLKEVPGIEKVEPSRIIRPQVNINDPYWSQMWGVNNTSYPGYDVNCKAVWDSYGTMGNASVTVGVIDGGIQADHPDLKANIAATGHYNYVTGKEGLDAISQHDHGTHVAGTIAAVGNNGAGVIGIAGGNAAAGKPGVKLLSLQVFQTGANGRSITASNFSRALKEAADRGAIISQNSWGHNFDFNEDGVVSGYELDYARSAHNNPETSFVQAVEYFNKYAGCDNEGKQLPGSPMKGGLVIFAAGNDDIPYGSPGNYEGCLSVGAMSRNGTRASFSNYGEWVDICAPGVGIVSTYINNGYISYSGTSMACPHVSGVAALIVSHFGGQGFTAEDLRRRLIEGARPIDASTGSKPIGPLVDALGAFQVGSTGGGAPEAVSDWTVAPVGHNLRVDFKTVDGAYGYMVAAATSKTVLEKMDWDNPDKEVVYANKVLLNVEAGTEQNITLTGLVPDKDYHVGIVAYSYDHKFSSKAYAQAHTAANRPPQIEFPNYPEDGLAFEHYQNVSLPVRVTDLDGDPVKVEIRNAGTGRAQLESNNGSESLYNFKLVCMLSEPDTYMAILTATDELGAQAKMTVKYTIKANTAPVVVSTPQALVMATDAPEQELDVAPFFSDPDGESLVYMVSSSAPTLVRAGIKDNLLTLTALAQGSSTITVTAIDHNDERAQVSFAVVVKPEGAGEVFLSGDTVLSSGVITIIPGVEEAPMTVRVISASGVVVYETSGTHSAQKPLALDLSNVAPGIYTVEVTYKGETYTYTIVKR